MLHDVVSAIYQGGYLIELEFDDGQRGIVDFTKYLERRGVFERFKNLEFFRSFAVNKELGVLTWGNEIDIAPETLYAEATGTPLPAWMNLEKESQKNEDLHTDSPLSSTNKDLHTDSPLSSTNKDLHTDSPLSSRT